MSDAPATYEQRITPALSYADAPAAIEFLCRAFGFEERYRLEMPDGSIGHAELTYRDATISLASAWTEGGLGSPQSLPHLHACIQVYVDDVDSHCERSKAEGAEIYEELGDQFYGDRTYRAHDLEGHRWWFHQRLREVSVEEMQAAIDAMGSE
ncbi:MAG: VOC family protein [Chloroflexi bacterium]|nr:VOC family protein [Chloroflexota bacterium]